MGINDKSIEKPVLKFKYPNVKVYSAKDEEGHPIGGKCILCGCSPTDMRIESEQDANEPSGYLHYSCWHFINHYSRNFQYTFKESLELIKHQMFGETKQNRQNNDEKIMEETIKKRVVEMIGGC